MSYIITESQEKKLKIFRKIHRDKKWIYEIVLEGCDLNNVCEYLHKENFVNSVIKDSAKTYLFSLFDSPSEEGFQSSFKFVCEFIKKELSKGIERWWDDYKPDCNDD